MAVVEIPTHVCHIVGSKITGAEAIIGHDCPGTPIWEPLPCVDLDLPLITCNPSDLTLQAAVATSALAVACSPSVLTLSASPVVSLPSVPVYEEAP